MVGVRWLTVGLGLWFPTLSAESRPTDEDLSVGTPGQAERMGHGGFVEMDAQDECDQKRNSRSFDFRCAPLGMTDSG